MFDGKGICLAVSARIVMLIARWPNGRDRTSTLGGNRVKTNRWMRFNNQVPIKWRYIILILCLTALLVVSLSLIHI